MSDKKEMALAVECEECKEKFSVTGNDITHKREYRVKEQSIYLTYYDCPNCGRRHFVQIDDDKSLDMLDVNSKQFAHNAVIRTTGRKLRKKKVDEYKKSKRHLANYRIELMKQFTGVVLHDDDTESDFELRFSV